MTAAKSATGGRALPVAPSRAPQACVAAGLLALSLGLSACARSDAGALGSAPVPPPAEPTEAVATADPPQPGPAQAEAVAPAPVPPLQAAAEAVLRQDDPDFDDYYTQFAFGDLDRDGRDDVAVEYGIGEEGAMRHIANNVRVLLMRDAGLELQRDEPDLFRYCAAVRGIERGRLQVDSLEACMIPFPRTDAHYEYEWTGQGLRLVAERSNEEQIQAQLGELAQALRSGRSADAAAFLRPGPVAAGEAPGAPDPLFDDAARRAEFIAAVEALSEQSFRRSGDNELVATRALASPGGARGERKLHVNLKPEGELAELGAGDTVNDAVATLEWPQGDGVGYSVRFLLIQGRLYLLDHSGFDSESE